MKLKTPLVTAALISITTIASAQYFEDFSGFSDGDLNGQGGWSRIFGPEPLFNIAAGDLQVESGATSGAVRNPISDTELGDTFDNSASVLEMTLNYTLDTTPGGAAFGQNIQVWHGTNFGTAAFQIYLREDGWVSFQGDGALQSTFIGTGSHTIVGTIDYANNTLDFIANGTQSLNGGSAIGFISGAEEVNTIRLGGPGAALSSVDNLTINSIGISAIPEPSSYALIAGSLALCWMMTRRRR